MKNQVEITNGKVTLKSFIDRKTYRSYKQKLGEGVSLDANAEGGSLPIFNMELAAEALVLGCIESIEVSEKPVTADQNFIDRLDQKDFDKILDACNKMMHGDEEKKSKSSDS